VTIATGIFVHLEFGRVYNLQMNLSQRYSICEVHEFPDVSFCNSVPKNQRMDHRLQLAEDGRNSWEFHEYRIAPAKNRPR
jgi:hypothetical protein